LWMIPAGETPQRVRDNPALAGVEIGNTGSGAVSQVVVLGNMLVYTNVSSNGTPHLFAVDKSTGEELARLEVPEVTRYGMSSWVHEGKQYLILQTGSTLTAMALAD